MDAFPKIACCDDPSCEWCGGSGEVKPELEAQAEEAIDAMIDAMMERNFEERETE
jgi:hypothetical protein